MKLGILGLLLVQVALSAATSLSAAVFHCDPVRGSVAGDGSAARPWGGIEETLAAGKVAFRSAAASESPTTAPCGPGDTILLHSGWHGVLRIPGGDNPRPLTLAAAPGERPEVGWVDIRAGANWIVRGLTISPSLAPTPLGKRPRNLVSLGEHGDENCRNLVVEDCFIFTERDSAHWTAADWMAAAGGIWLGRHGRGHMARNNYVLNTRFGIQLCAPGCVAEGNVVANFSADGMRVMRDDQVARFNVIKNIFVSAKDGDPNHDDGIQAFLFNRGRGTLRRIQVEENIILARATPGLPFPAGLQGIGFFDGPLVDFHVAGNVVGVDHYHGISLYDAQGCVIEDNVCFNPAPEGKRPWIMLGRKRHDPAGNTVRHNRAARFNLALDPTVQAADNARVTAALYRERLAALTAKITTRFGATHPVAGLPRLAAAAGD